MPAGCEFTCKNKDCKNFNSGFTIHAPWPIGKIEDILEAQNVREKEQFSKGLENMKASGENLACIVFPNINSVDTVGIRTQTFCEKCYCIGNFDSLLKDGETMEELKVRASIEAKEHKCPMCKGSVKSFLEIIESGIPCPSCGNKLLQNRWYSKEVINEKERRNG